MTASEAMSVYRVGSSHLIKFGQVTRPFGAANLRFLSTAAHTSTTAVQSLVDSSNVYVKNDQYGGAGAFAARSIREGELVERGIVRRLNGLDGNHNPYVFTWSDDRKVWAMGSGCSTFYNTADSDVANTKMDRDFEKDEFKIWALRDIAKDEELTHVYKSKRWRTCFVNDKNL